MRIQASSINSSTELVENLRSREINSLLQGCESRQMPQQNTQDIGSPYIPRFKALKEGKCIEAGKKNCN
jgi:hypothetical protein